MNIQRFFKRYVHSSVKLFCFFILVNVVLFVILAMVSVDRRDVNPTRLLSRISNDLQQTNGQYVLPNGTDALLEQEQVWCMLIDNTTGSVVWSYRLPADVPIQYTYGDVAEMTRWYIEDYPVFVLNRDDGLLVIGYPKDSYWKSSAYKPTSSVKIDIAGMATVFLLNIVIVLLLFVFNNRKIERSIKPILVGIEDISAGKKTQLAERGELSEINAQLNHVAEALQRRDAARANWISGVSHDIRTPLSMVLGYSSSLEESDALTAGARRKVVEIRQQAEKIKWLIEDLNLASRLEYDMQPLRICDIYLTELVRQVVCEFLDSNLDDLYLFEVESSPQCETEFIRGDEALLKRALANLIQNSITHNPEGCTVSILVSYSKAAITIVVADNGVGVSSERLKELREKSHYTESTDDRLDLRHGLGLILVRQIVEAHQGTMEIESEAQKGYKTTLTFSKA